MIRESKSVYLHARSGSGLGKVQACDWDHRLSVTGNTGGLAVFAPTVAALLVALWGWGGSGFAGPHGTSALRSGAWITAACKDWQPGTGTVHPDQLLGLSIHYLKGIIVYNFTGVQVRRSAETWPSWTLAWICHNFTRQREGGSSSSSRNVVRWWDLRGLARAEFRLGFLESRSWTL